MSAITIYLKGWHNGSLYADAINHVGHELHTEARGVRLFQRYEDGDVMHLAFEYVADDHVEDAILCEEAFRWFNIDDELPVARRYRSAGNRSLSVGDVVVIDGRAWAVGSFGWDRIEDFKPTLTER
jgi:uncharacterized protein YbaR (Trm112 family)